MSGDNTDNSDDVVGYKKPPRRTQFKPGQSGNPKGRPKKQKTVTDVFLKQVNKTATFSINGKEQRKTMLEAIALKHVSMAVTGDAKSTALVFKALKPHEKAGEDNLSGLLLEFREKNAWLGAREKKQDRAKDAEPEED
jgi:Family of unknown function (DUF5681)